MMKNTPVRIAFATLVLVLVIGAYQFREMIYLNIRAADPILPGWEEYEPTRFADLQTRGEPLLVEIYASWCPTCYAQHRAFEAMQAEGHAPAIRAIRVDFDHDRAFVRSLGINYTGMLILYRGKNEVARAAGLTTPEAIRTFLDSHGVSAAG